MNTENGSKYTRGNLAEGKFIAEMERLAGKIGGFQPSANTLFSLYEELDWLDEFQLMRLIDRLKMDDKFPNLNKILVVLQGMGIAKNKSTYLNNGGNSGEMLDVECDECGASFVFRKTDDTNSHYDCPNIFYNRCNRSFTHKELLNKTRNK